MAMNGDIEPTGRTRREVRDSEAGHALLDHFRDVLVAHAVKSGILRRKNPVCVFPHLLCRTRREVRDSEADFWYVIRAFRAGRTRREVRDSEAEKGVHRILVFRQVAHAVKSGILRRILGARWSGSYGRRTRREVRDSEAADLSQALYNKRKSHTP